MISLIVARARDGAIGRDGTIPWHLPEDLKAFQRETLGGAIIMGRKTWDSLPVQPLKNRLNVVVSRGQTTAPVTVESIEAAIAACHAAGYMRIYGIGGYMIYRDMLPLAQRLLVTEVDLDVPDADTFFPAFAEAEWENLADLPLRDSGPRAVMREWLRKAAPA